MTGRQDIVLIGGKPLRYRVRRHRRARAFRVNVSQEEGVVVVIPWRASLMEVPPLMEGWGPWLEKKADQFNCWRGPEVRCYATGSQVLVLGLRRTLELSALPAGRSRSQVTLQEDRLNLVLPPKEIWDPRPALEKWLRRFARRKLDSRVAHWSEKTDLVPQKVIIGDRKTRWGSCSSRGTLSFCYRLIMAPIEVVDAVVVHELCHLRHLNHSKRFYALLDAHCPGHRKAGNWLRDNHEDMQL